MKYDPFNSNDRSPWRVQGGPAIPSRQALYSPGVEPEVAPGGYELVEERDTGGFLEYWRILRRHKTTLFLLAALGAILGSVLSLSQRPVYQAHTSLEVEELAPDPSNMKQVGWNVNGGSASAVSDMPTQIKILQSESLIERALARVRPAKGGERQGEEPKSFGWRKLLNLPAPPPDQDSDLPAKVMANLSVRADGQTRIVDLAYDSPDPKQAADFVNALATEFIEENTEAHWNLSQRTAEWLNRELTDMRNKLERSEGILQDYATRSGLMFMSDKGSVSDEKLRQLQTALANAQIDGIAKQSRYEVAVTEATGVQPDTLDDPVAREYQSKIVDLVRHRAEMATMYTPEYSKMKEVDAQIATLRGALEAEHRAMTEHIKNQFQESSRRKELLTANYETQAQLFNQEAEKAIQYSILKREVDSNRDLYDAMLQRTKMVSVASAFRMSNVRVLDPAKLPRFPYKPKLSVNTMLGCITGLLLGIVLTIVRDRADGLMQDRGDVNVHLNLPELGVIPEFAAGPQKPKIAECFRASVASILFSLRSGSQSRVLVVTSWGPGEGKTTAVSNLGVALAEIGRRVLIIDGDMRKPNVHSLFAMDNKVGLSDLLSGTDARITRPPETLIRETAVAGLSILTSGPVKENPTSLLYSQRLKDLIQVLRTDYDAVLIDSPPMQTMTDARLLGALADAVVLVVRANSTSRESARAAKQRFFEDGTNVLGAILNYWWDPRPNSSGAGEKESHLSFLRPTKYSGRGVS